MSSMGMSRALLTKIASRSADALGEPAEGKTSHGSAENDGDTGFGQKEPFEPSHE